MSIYFNFQFSYYNSILYVGIICSFNNYDCCKVEVTSCSFLNFKLTSKIVTQIIGTCTCMKDISIILY